MTEVTNLRDWVCINTMQKYYLLSYLHVILVSLTVSS
jgi:hypothetical protein